MRPVLLCGLLICLGTGCQTEIAKWEFAQAELHAESGDVENAIPRLKKSLVAIGAPPNVKLRLADFISRQGDPDSVRLCDEVLALEWASSSDIREAILELKSRCQQHTGEFEAALKTFKQVLADRVARTADELNGLAYCRALANRELMMAADNIEKAIGMEEEVRWPSGMYLPLPVKAGMAIGILSRHSDDQANVIKILNQQINSVEADYLKIRSLVSMTVFAQIQLTFPLGETEENQTQLARNRQDVLRGCLVSLLTVRALLHQDLGDDRRCNEDRFRVQDLGYDSGDLAKQLPGKYHCVDLLQKAMMYLDTRGFILGLLPWDDAGGMPPDVVDGSELRLGSYAGSISDLNLALAATRTLRMAMENSIFNSPELSVKDAKKHQADLKRTEGVLLYHRLLVHEKKGDATAAKQDEQLVRDLGFEPNESLF